MDHGACSNSEKLLVKFDGDNYTGWVDKMKFMLISLEVFYVLEPNLSPIPEDPVGEKADVKVITDLEKQRMLRKQDEALCFKYIKNSLSDRLCDLYALRSNNDPRLLWKALEANFKPTENVKTNHLIEQFLAFRMVDGKKMMDQAIELRIILEKLKDHSIIIPDAFHIVALITKLPPSWKLFTQRMMNYNNLSLKVVLKQIRAEERARKGKDKQSVTFRRPPVNNTRTTRGDHGQSEKQLGVKKANNNFKKTAPHRNVCSTDAINAIDADRQIDDLVSLINLSML